MVTLAVVNLLLGIVSIFFTGGVALGALAYALDGIRREGFARRWNLFVALLLGLFAWGSVQGIGDDFARASDGYHYAAPADASAVFAVVFWALVTSVVCMAGMQYARGALRSRPPARRG